MKNVDEIKLGNLENPEKNPGNHETPKLPITTNPLVTPKLELETPYERSNCSTLRPPIIHGGREITAFILAVVGDG